MLSSTSPADRSGLRRANLALLVRTMREHGQVSRAQLAVHSGLSKATVSSLVTDLARRGLVRSAGTTAGGQGRPGELVELRPASATGIGLDVHVEHVGATAVDLTGDVLHTERVPCDVASLGPERVLDELAAATCRALAAVEARGGWVSGATVAVPGLVDTDAGIVRIAPRLRWREVAVLDGLAARTGLPLEFFGADNDANLGARAEVDADPANSPKDFVYLTGDHGVGGGLVCGGALVRGALGHAGEVGHMSLDPLGRRCSCGRRGCWETRVAHGVVGRGARVQQGAEAGDRRTLDALHQIGAALGSGIAVLVNLLNPAVVVLGGYFAALPEWLVDPIRSEVAAGVLADGAGGAAVVASRLGFRAPSIGGAVHALRRVLDDPTVVPIEDNEEAPA